MTYSIQSEAQLALNNYYLENLLKVLTNTTNTITAKKIHSYLIVSNGQLETRYALTNVGDFIAVGLQCSNNTYIYKFNNEEESLYISYSSNGLVPILKDVCIINNNDKHLTKNKTI